MSNIASGINKLLTFKKQTAKGAPAPATTPFGQSLRRTQSTLDKKKATYASKEIRPSLQKADFRHGVIAVDGTISGELSVGTYQSFIESVLRQTAQTAVSVAGLTDIVAASTGANTGTLTTTAGAFLTGNLFKLGMIVRCTGFTTTAVANNACNMMITAMTNKVLTVVRLDGAAIVAKTETGAVTIAEAGKHVMIPQTGHSRDYYTIEHYFGDIAQSEKFTDCVITQMDIKLPGTGMATIDFNVMGLDMTDATSQYFTTPLAVSTGGILAAANGVVYLQGQAIALITGMNVAVKGGHSVIGGVVGSNLEPDVFPGNLDVDGQITMLFIDATARDYFLDETEVSIYAVFTADNTAASGFTAINLPRVKMGGASKDDGEKGVVLTMPFTALENVAGGSGITSHASTIIIQDSAFV